MALRRGQRDSTAVDERGRKQADARDPPRKPMTARETKSRTVDSRRRAAQTAAAGKSRRCGSRDAWKGSESPSERR
ncbi:hypothetical protein ERJ75_001540600 [Trypanosoma vivax]|nr:hypothetical protein ERJ75_001540600 [Trypanosoma vivax]